MAATSEEAFKVFLSWLAPSDTALAKAAVRRDEIQSRLHKKFVVNAIYEGGSLHHGTGVQQVSGADYFCWLDMRRPTSEGALKAVRKSLQGLYPGVPVRISRPGVVVDFADGAERVAVIPAFASGSDLGQQMRFRVPGVRQEWMTVSPPAHQEWLESCNSRRGVLGGAKGLARLACAWKHYRQVPISSFYLQTKAVDFMAERTTVLYPYDLRDFLNSLWLEGLAPMADPLGIAGAIEPCGPEMWGDALSKTANAAGWARSAVTQQGLGSTGQAFRYWNLIFGGRFPALY